MFLAWAQSSYCLVEFNFCQEDWRKEKREFLQSLNRISTLPRTNMIDTSNVGTRPGQTASLASSPRVSSGITGMDIVPLASKPIMDKKASIYAEVVKNLNKARECGLPFKVRPSFSDSIQFRMRFHYIILKIMWLGLLIEGHCFCLMINLVLKARGKEVN